MKIGIISDTHDHAQECNKAVEILERETKKVIHCGDFNTFNILKMFKNRKFEFMYVRGDHESESIRNETGGTVPDGEILEFNVGPWKFGAYHNTYQPGQRHSKVYESISSGKYDYFLYGHLHFFNVKFSEPKFKTIAINPGGMYIDGQWSFVILDLEKREVELLTYYQGHFCSTLKVLLDKVEYSIKYDKNNLSVREYLKNLMIYLDNSPKNYTQTWSEGNANAWLNHYWKNEFRKMGLK